MKDNGTMMQYFHWYYGNSMNDPELWVHVQNEAKRLALLGVTALWLPPAFKASSFNSGGKSDHEKFSTGYDIYDLYDLGEFNQKGSVRTKYGTRKQYISAIREAQSNGINIYADVVLNHKAGADRTEWVKAARVAWDNRNYVIEDELWVEAWTKFTFDGRGDKYSDFKWTMRHFDGVDWAANLPGDRASGIFKFTSFGKDWAKLVSGENGNYDYLMFSDIDMNSPDVRTELANWGKWFIDNTGVNGFRLDAIKHIQYSFFRDWLQYLRKEHPNLFAVGEYWSYEIGDLTHYIDKTEGCMSLFDAPLQNNFYQASRDGNGWYDMRTLFDNTLVRIAPCLAVTLVDNHDTQPCQALEHWVDWWFRPLAYAIILLRQEGYPSVFYPDLYGAQYTDKGFDVNLSAVENIELLMSARKNLAYGTQRDYFDDRNVAGWTREGDKEHSGSGLAVLLNNGHRSATKWMEVGKNFSGRTMYDYLGKVHDAVQVNEHGWAEFRVNSRSVSVWVLK